MADTHYADSCSRTDVGSAITAASSGDTVIVPNGSATWASQLVITKGLTVMAATSGGVSITAGFDQADGNAANSANFLISYAPTNMAADEPFRLSGFDFDMDSRCMFLRIGTQTRPSTTLTKIRIDHNSISDCVTRVLQLWGSICGVIDNNTFDNPQMAFSYDGCNQPAWQDLTYTFGSSNAMFFEDNTVTNHTYGPHEGGDGARVVIRHNTYTMAVGGNLYPWVDMHGDQYVGNWAGMGIEIYGNTMTHAGNGGVRIDMRGGKCLIYNNNVITSGADEIQIREEFIDGESHLIGGSEKLPSYSAISNQPQHISDTYVWSNTKNGAGTPSYLYSRVTYPSSSSIVRPEDLGRTIPQANVDYWIHTASFDGSSGVGVGLLEDRPSSGLAVGVGYWATDTNTLYRATGATTWESYYTPYDYPHPLRGQYGEASWCDLDVSIDEDRIGVVDKVV